MTTLPTDYGPLVRELQRRAAAIHQPVNGAFELTERCNLSCQMCYVRHPAHDAARRQKELSASEWLTLAHDAVDNGMVFLLLTGGEVFLRPDFFDIYTPLTRLGLLITLFTNGTLVTDRIAQRLAEAPPSLTQITLYGATAATYEAVTGVPGAYARCCAGIEALLKYRVRLELKTTITRRNAVELEDMKQMARNWGLGFTAGWLLMRRRDGTPSDVEDCRLSAYDSASLEDTERLAADERIEAALRDPHASNPSIFNCQAGKSAFAINSSGEMNPCLNLSLPAARPLDTGFRASMERLLHFVDDAPPLGSVCLACEMRGYCPRCPAWSAMETGTLTEPVPYLCNIACQRKERYERLLE
jgi:radical SAM protein with 4Fe4S-binding SPASM domain